MQQNVTEPQMIDTVKFDMIGYGHSLFKRSCFRIFSRFKPAAFRYGLFKSVKFSTGLFKTTT